MSHGFIDPTAGARERFERIELLITEALSQLDRSHISPEAQAILADLESADTYRRELALRKLHADMAADPVETCPRCRHVAHDSLGFCPNMASDNDCSCRGSAA